MIDYVLIDMDGVVVDFISHAFVANGGTFDPSVYPRDEWSIATVLGITETEFWNNIDNDGASFWLNLPAYPWMKELIGCVESFVGKNWSFATSPSRAGWSAAGKVMWLQEKFSSRFRNYMIGEHKHLMAKAGRVLIDDSQKNCERFREHGGNAIVFPQPWNLEDLNRDKVDVVREQLQQLACGS